MTREEAEIAIRKGVVNNEDYIQSLNKSKDIIKQIFDDHEEHVNDLRNAIDRYMEEAAMYKSILDKAEGQLKALTKNS